MIWAQVEAEVVVQVAVVLLLEAESVGTVVTEMIQLLA